MALRRNPIEIWSEGDFERPVSLGRTILGLRGAAHDPAAVRRIFLDNAANYRKDDLQLRVLRPGLGNGLLTAEGEDWRMQRRVARAAVFAPPGRRLRPGDAAGRGGGRRAARRRRDGAVAEVGALHVAHDARGAGADAVLAGARRAMPSAFQRAVTSYFDTIGRLDPLDLLGAPALSAAARPAARPRRR